MAHDEHQAAVALIQWWDYFSIQKNLPQRLLFAIPNGEKREWRAAARLKAEGVRPGISDYFLSIPRGGKHGLYIELKKGGVGIKPGRPTPDQISFGAMVQEQGYEFHVAYGALEAEDLIEGYLKSKGGDQ